MRADSTVAHHGYERTLQLSCTRTAWLAVLLGWSLAASGAVLWRQPAEWLVRDNGAGEDVLHGAVEPQDDTSGATLFFKFTVDPLSDASVEYEMPVQAGLVLFEGGVERLGVGNGLRAHAFSAFNTASTGLFFAPSATAEVGEYDLNAGFQGGAQGLMGRPRRGVLRTILFRVQYVPGADDRVTVWFEPDLSPGNTELTQKPTQVTQFKANASFDAIHLVHRGGGDGWRFSDLAIATSFGDFVPLLWWRRPWVISVALPLLLGIVALPVWLLVHVRARREIRKLERQSALEKERARIARDLHDEVGAGLTELLLAGEELGAVVDSPHEREQKLREMLSHIRGLGYTMDEIVWAVNPLKDTVDDMVGYLSSFAQRFLGLSGISCRLSVPTDMPALGLESSARHGLFLAVKEALNNAVKHAGASEVELRVSVSRKELVIEVEDNGKGFNVDGAETLGNGLRNLRERLEDLGGRAEVTSTLGKGTLVRYSYPWRAGK